MSQNIRYQSSHEYARKKDDEIVTGISDHAQAELGDIVFVELPTIGKTIAKGVTFGVVESVKAASDLYMPMAGTITAVNTELEGDPSLVNKDCMGAGWMIQFSPVNPSEWESLLDEVAYEAQSAAQAGKE
ncbi:MAG: glycine cleavage system protein GcvH [Rectinemataceae bacterium]|nr:glycine cleavage system protein GcvH [Rectinemataceae bacterium]